MTAIDNSFDEIKGLIDQARSNALQSINIHLIQLYWKIGAFISGKLAVSQWGEKTFEQLAEYLHRFGPDYTGVSNKGGFTKYWVYVLKALHITGAMVQT